MDIANKTAVDCACSERWGVLRPWEELHWNKGLKPNPYCKEFNGGGESGLHLPLASKNKELIQCDCNPEARLGIGLLGSAKADNFNDQVKLVMDDVANNAKFTDLKTKFDANLALMQAVFVKQWAVYIHELQAEYGVEFAMPEWRAPVEMPAALTVEKFVLRDGKHIDAKWSCCCKSKNDGGCKKPNRLLGMTLFHHEAPVEACK